MKKTEEMHNIRLGLGGQTLLRSYIGGLEQTRRQLQRFRDGEVWWGGGCILKELEALKMNTSPLYLAKAHACQENLILATLISRGKKVFFILPMATHTHTQHVCKLEYI